MTTNPQCNLRARYGTFAAWTRSSSSHQWREESRDRRMSLHSWIWLEDCCPEHDWRRIVAAVKVSDGMGEGVLRPVGYLKVEVVALVEDPWHQMGSRLATSYSRIAVGGLVMP